MTPRSFTSYRHDELMIDLFAGGGGASTGITMATNRQVDVAVNHDPAAIALHQANHPETRHMVSDVFEVDPRDVTEGRPVGLLWASPDCTFHSKARGAKPFRSKETKRRALAWVVTRWAGQVRPRVIMLENVEEFAQWGPLVGPPTAQRPDPKRRGQTFRKWVRSLTRLGYDVQWRELRACDYGAPTIRKRLFLIARCDGAPIVWPKPTHGPRRPLPWRTAAECIDWEVPMLSIFASREEARSWGKLMGQATPVRPLAAATLRRVARGVVRFVVENPRPFIVGVGGRQGQSAERGLDQPLQTITAKGDSAIVAPVLAHLTHGGRERSVEEPFPTITAAPRGEMAMLAPLLVPRYGERPGQDPRTRSIEEPMPVIVPTGNGASLVAAFLARHWGGMVGKDLREPFPTVLCKGAQDQLAAVFLSHAYTSNTNGGNGDLTLPLKTQTTANHAGLVLAFLQKYYGQGIGQELTEPMHTTRTKASFGLVTVEVQGEPFYIADIAMRMLQPRELYNAQGFPQGYQIDRSLDGKRFTKTEQVRMVGNSVSPQIACALAAANVPELVLNREAVA